MKKRSECNCQCHTDGVTIHIVPCCEPDAPIQETFNNYCAKVLVYEIYKPTPYREGVTVFPTYEKNGKTICLVSCYNPYDNLNEMAEVFDKLWSDCRIDKSKLRLLCCFDPDSNIKEAMRKFIISTMEDTNEPDVPYEQKIICSKCGMDFSGTTGYVCNNANCPMGLNGTTC